MSVKNIEETGFQIACKKCGNKNAPVKLRTRMARCSKCHELLYLCACRHCGHWQSLGDPSRSFEEVKKDSCEKCGKPISVINSTVTMYPLKCPSCGRINDDMELRAQKTNRCQKCGYSFMVIECPRCGQFQDAGSPWGSSALGKCEICGHDFSLLKRYPYIPALLGLAAIGIFLLLGMPSGFIGMAVVIWILLLAGTFLRRRIKRMGGTKMEGPNSEEIPELIKDLSAEDPIRRRDAAEALGKIKNPDLETVRGLIAVMKDHKEESVQKEAGRILGKMNIRDEKAVEAMLSALR